MNINDLNELKQWFADLTDNSLIAHGNGQYEPVDQDKVNAVNELIDAEIERQSVTVEDVKDAICAVKQIMNRLVEIDEDFMRMAGADRETWCLIIDALEHYQTIRIKHCPNCGLKLEEFE